MLDPRMHNRLETVKDTSEPCTETHHSSRCSYHLSYIGPSLKDYLQRARESQVDLRPSLERSFAIERHILLTSFHTIEYGRIKLHRSMNSLLSYELWTRKFIRWSSAIIFRSEKAVIQRSIHDRTPLTTVRALVKNCSSGFAPSLRLWRLQIRKETTLYDAWDVVTDTISDVRRKLYFTSIPQWWVMIREYGDEDDCLFTTTNG